MPLEQRQIPGEAGPPPGRVRIPGLPSQGSVTAQSHCSAELPPGLPFHIAGLSAGANSCCHRHPELLELL